MISAMRTLALDYLFEELDGGHPPVNLDAWYRELRCKSLEKLFPFLVESTEGAEKVYVISQPAQCSFAELSVQDMKPEIAPYLPFVKMPGPRDAQAGPIIKRSYSKEKGAGPTSATLSATMASFSAITKESKPWSGYFAEVVKVLSCPEVKLEDGSMLNWQSLGYQSMLEGVVQTVDFRKNGALVSVKDAHGNFPAQRTEYVDYLRHEKLAGDRYVTKKASARIGVTCPLCREAKVQVFPNALKGAGLNFKNVDREGAFPGLDINAAWKGYSLCAPCADLLYIYKNHVLKKVGPKRERIPFMARVAGERALIVPFCTTHARARQQLLRNVIRFINGIPDDVGEDEQDLLDLLKDEKSLLNLHFLWADIGQDIDNVRGVLTDVPPSRLSELSEFNLSSKDWEHPVFPRVKLKNDKLDFRANLSLNALYPLFLRPGGKKAQSSNESRRLFQLRRTVAAAVYHKSPLPMQRFWDELMITANGYWLQAMEDKEAFWGLLIEGEGKRGPYLTAAGWIRHVAWWLHYFRCVEVMEMAESFFEPRMERLKPYFGRESGIDTQEKAFAFLTGILYGRLLEVQGARGVNVSSNALTWLKRLTLKGKDLPELYVKIREKLLAYESEKSRKVRELISEIGILGVKLGDSIELSQTQTSYYLLLGQSMARTVLKKDEEE
jgi:CRISPR-associated protein Csh1